MSLPPNNQRANQAILSLGRQRLILIFCGGVLAAVSIFGNPYRYYQYNSGRYLVLPLKIIDPGLFPNDQVVESLSRYHSLFYEGLGKGLRALNATPASLPLVVDGLYLLSKVAMILAMILLARRLSGDFWSPILLAAWTCHLKSPFIGGVSLNMPTLTHLEVVYLMALFALVALFAGRTLFFWLLLSASIFLHSLAAFQFALCTLPLFLNKRLGREHWAGAAIFALCCLIYFLTMAPPRLSAQEGRLFVEAERLSSHINLYKYKPFHWAGVLGTLAVAGLGWRSFDRSNEKSALLIKFALMGTIVAIGLSFLAVRTESVTLSLFQPLRLFYWVGLFCALALATTAVKAFRQSMVGGIMLSAPLALVAVDSRWSVVCIALAIFYLVSYEALARSTPGRRNLVDQCFRWGIAALSIIFLSAWAIGGRFGFASLRQPDLVPIAAICLLTTAVFYQRRGWRSIAAALAIASCLGVASVQSRRFFEERSDPAWDEIRRWSRDHTEQDARFLTPPEKANFRVLALRSSQSERITQLSWVDPFVYQQNARDVQRVEQLTGKANNDPKALISLAKELHCRYLVTQDPLPEDVIPRFRVGTYSIVEVE